MNYAKRYLELIETRRARQEQKGIVGYRESHHIVPRCMGGSNSSYNLVQLTPEEHFTAHLLLMKIYPWHEGLAYACYMMAKGGRLSNKLVGKMRRQARETTSAASRKLKYLRASGLTPILWLKMTQEYCRLHSVLGRKRAITAVYELLRRDCSITSKQVESYTRLPIIKMTMQEYIDEYCTT